MHEMVNKLKIKKYEDSKSVSARGSTALVRAEPKVRTGLSFDSLIYQLYICWVFLLTNSIAALQLCYS